MKTLIKLASQRTKIPALNCILVKGGVARAFDMVTAIEKKTNAPDGVYHAAGFDVSPIENKKVHVDNMPVPIKKDVLYEFNAPLKEFLGDIEFVIGATSKDQTGYSLCDVCLDNKGFVATNGAMLSAVKKEGIVAHGDDKKYIMARDSLKWAVALLKEYKKEGDSVRLTINPFQDRHHGIFTLSIFDKNKEMLTFIQGKLVDGTYPKYEGVIPSKEDMVSMGKLDKEKLKPLFEHHKALCKIKRIGKYKIRGVYFEGNTAQVHDDNLTFETGLNFPHEVAFNPEYLKLATDGVGYFKKSTVPFLIEKGDRLSVIMPMI